jgi:hypothetical protein
MLSKCAGCLSAATAVHVVWWSAHASLPFAAAASCHQPSYNATRWCAVLLSGDCLQGRALGVAAAVAATAYSTTVIPNQAANCLHLLSYGILLVRQAAAGQQCMPAAAARISSDQSCWRLQHIVPGSCTPHALSISFSYRGH